LVLGNSKIDVRKWVHGRDIGRFTRSVTFFIGFYLYLLLIVDLRLIYHGAGEISNFPSFFKGWDFFREFVSRPGGPVEYFASFLSQLFYIGWAGALVATLQAWLIYACIGYFLKAIEYRKLRWIRFIPSLLLLVIYTQYTYHFVTVTALLAALVFVCLYLNMISKGSKSGWLRLFIFLIMSITLYYIAAGAYLLFAVICTMYELLFRGRWLTGLLCLLLSAVIPYVEGVLVFSNSSIDAFCDLLPFSWKFIAYKAGGRMVTIVYLLYLLMPLTALVLGLWQVFVKLYAKRKYEGQETEKPPTKPLKLITGIYSWYFQHKKIKWIFRTVFLFGFAFGVVVFSYDIERKTLFEVEYYKYRKMWPQVLKAARNHLDSFPVILAVNRALYHIGRLNTDMFSYPQHTGTLFLTVKGSEREYWKKFDLFIELGLVNFAYKDLSGCLEIFGERPLVLKRLALVNMAKGNINSARIFLNKLAKTLFDAKWAEDYLELLLSDPNLLTDSQIQHLRSMMLQKDYAFSVIDYEDILLDLLEKNPQNRMAFEYLMAAYLLTNHLDGFVRNIARLDDFNYSKIPRLYEEALLVYVYRTRKSVNLYGRQLTPESNRRFDNFSQTYQQRYGQNKQAAFKELAKEYGDTYLFYYIYGFSGVKQWAGGQ